jgi:hypothetical protein
MSEPEAPTICLYCKRELRGFYEIKHVKPDGSTSPKLVRVCSVVCLIQWAYRYGVSLGVRGLAGLHALITKIGNLRGPQGQGQQGQNTP